MAPEVKRLPDGVALSPLAHQVFECVARYTAFPWPVLMTQCRRCQIDPATIDDKALRRLIEPIVTSVARFTSPGKGASLKRELEALLPSAKDKDKERE
jgi:hypothetical protein